MTAELILEKESKTLGKQSFRSDSNGPQITECVQTTLKLYSKQETVYNFTSNSKSS